MTSSISEEAIIIFDMIRRFLILSTEADPEALKLVMMKVVQMREAPQSSLALSLEEHEREFLTQVYEYLDIASLEICEACGKRSDDVKVVPQDYSICGDCRKM